jgi:hypothetical protein
VGILKHLLFWPVTGPLALTEFAVNRVRGVVHGELTDDQRVKEDLMVLQMELELGTVSDEEYERREAELMERLREVRRWRQELGIEKEWAPLEFQGAEPADEPGSPKSGAQDDPGPENDRTWSPDSSTDSPRGSSSS